MSIIVCSLAGTTAETLTSSMLCSDGLSLMSILAPALASTVFVA